MGGADLAGYAADDVRTVIGGCPQDPHIFNATIARTFGWRGRGRPGPSWTAAAARARLLPFIQSLPQGWDTPGGRARRGDVRR